MHSMHNMLYSKMYKEKDLLPGKTVYNENVNKEFIVEKATRRHCGFSVFFMSSTRYFS